MTQLVGEESIYRRAITHRGIAMKERPIRLLWVVVFAVLGTLGAMAKEPAVIEFRLVLDRASAETEDLQFYNDPIEATEVLHVLKRPVVDQTAIRSASVKNVKGTPDYYVEVVFTDRGRDRIAEVTKENIGKRLAIVVSGTVIVAPKIVAEISEGKVWIAGRFDEDDASELAARINKSLKGANAANSSIGR